MGSLGLGAMIRMDGGSFLLVQSAVSVWTCVWAHGGAQTTSCARSNPAQCHLKSRAASPEARERGPFSLFHLPAILPKITGRRSLTGAQRALLQLTDHFPPRRNTLNYGNISGGREWEWGRELAYPSMQRTLENSFIWLNAYPCCFSPQCCLFFSVALLKW